jgi:CDP-diacylglycerol---glycerol-3-phosphate 3-phosphatidyltransferase
VASPTITPAGSGRVRALAAGTCLRIVLVPVVMGLVLAGDDPGGGTATAAFVLFVLAAFTDYLDGYLARRWEVTTTLGSFLDTTADKLLVSGVLVALVEAGRASAWITVLIVGRELVILGLKGATAADGTVIAPSLLAKLKTTVQFAAIGLAILRPGGEVLGLYVDEWLMLAAAAITLASAVDYLARFASTFSTRPA